MPALEKVGTLAAQAFATEWVFGRFSQVSQVSRLDDEEGSFQLSWRVEVT